MATSGTYNFGNTTADRLITASFERCGISGSALSGEMTKASLLYSNLLLSNWANKGFRLWPVQKSMLTISPGQAYYPLPLGTVDIADEEITRTNATRQLNGTPFSSAGGNAENAFDGNPNTACTQTAPNGYISYDYGEGVLQCITYVGIQSNETINYTLDIEYSYDNVNWITAQQTGLQNYYLGQIVWYVVTLPQNARAWRIRETGGSTLNIQELYFDTPNLSITMRRMSRADYMATPNKGLTAPPSSFYVEQTTSPYLVVWPTPDNSWQYFVFNYQRQIQDLTQLTQNVDVPQKFLDTFVAGLSAYLARSFAPDKYELLSQEYENMYQIAANADEENVPMRIELSNSQT